MSDLRTTADACHAAAQRRNEEQIAALRALGRERARAVLVSMGWEIDKLFTWAKGCSIWADQNAKVEAVLSTLFGEDEAAQAVQLALF